MNEFSLLINLPVNFIEEFDLLIRDPSYRYLTL